MSCSYQTITTIITRATYHQHLGGSHTHLISWVGTHYGLHMYTIEVKGERAKDGEREKREWERGERGVGERGKREWEREGRRGEAERVGGSKEGI